MVKTMPADAQARYENEVSDLAKSMTDACAQAGMAMFLVIQDAPESYHTTSVNMSLAVGEKFNILNHMQQCWTTDELIESLINQALMSGHNSSYLKALGVPATGLRNQAEDS